MAGNRALALLFGVTLVATVGGCGKSPEVPASPPVEEEAPVVRVPVAPGPGRPAVTPKQATIDAGRSALAKTGGTITEGRCGAYQVLSSAGAEHLAVCESLARELDARYQARFGVSIGHPPEGLILLFGTRRSYQDFATQFGRLSAGYAGFTMASRGVVAVPVEDSTPASFAKVLAHEISHLVHRRVFGPNLVPWLSEGLADAIGDSATPDGFGDLAGSAFEDGSGTLATRLRRGLGAGQVHSITAVLSKTRQEFDRGTVSYDYESSALLVRYLLLEPTHASRFRSLLRKLAASEACDARCVLETLQVTARQLDEGFEEWLFGSKVG